MDLLWGGVVAIGRIGRAALGVAAGLGCGLWGACADASFLKPPGVGEVIASLGTAGFTREFDAAGRLRRSARFAKTTLDVHAGYGLGERVQAVALVSLESARANAAATDDRPGWSALAGARIGLWRGDFGEVSAQVMAGAARARAGAGAIADARLLYGVNLRLGSWPGFLDLQGDWRGAAPGARPEWRFDATLGVEPAPDWLALVQVFAAHGVAVRGLRVSQRVKLGLGLVWRPMGGPWRAQLGGFVTPLGRNAGAESGGALALWRSF